METTDLAIAEAVQRSMARPYRVELVPDEGGWFACIPELPGCMSQGETPEEALRMIREAQELWLEGALAKGMDIPEPEAEKAYNGRLLVRVPKDVHRDIARAADEQGVSINLFVASAVARALGRAS